VTGGAGFIGSNFIRYILRKYPSYRIINLDKLTYCGNLENLKDVQNHPNYKFVKGDICNSKIVQRIVKNCDAIINFAASTHVDRSILDSSDFVKTNFYGTFVLLEAARKNKTKLFIQISTDEAYGSIVKGSFDENSALSPNSPYAATKAAADLLVLTFFKTYRCPAIVSRSTNNFGPYQYPEKLMPLFITNSIDNKTLPLYGDGLNVRQWIYVEDNCRAIDLLLHKGKIGEVYNIGVGNEFTNLTLTKFVLQYLNKSTKLIKFVKDRPGHDKRYSIRIDKIKSLGFRPIFSFKEALKDTITWYVQNRLWWERIKKHNREFKSYYNKQYNPANAPKGEGSHESKDIT
jgi:dTDP-glucose 4,6-dehydratase